MRERLLYRLVLRVPKATAYGEDLFRAIFCLELDWGKLWRSKSLGAGVNQPEDPCKVRERLLYRLVLRVPKKEITRNRCLPARGPVGGERTASCAPAKGPVGGERRLPRRFRDSRRLEAWLKGRKRKKLLHRLVLRVPKATLDILGGTRRTSFGRLLVSN